jgi:S-formylglutathione hydrolase FrmB
MRGRRGLLAAAAVALVAALPGAAASAAAPRVVDEQRVSDRVLVLTIATDAFVAPTKVDVILPVGYDADPQRRWPVTYVTAGTMNNHDSFRRAGRGVELTADYPSIIVSPDGNSGYWSDWYNGGAHGPPMYETFVIDELIPLIDARLRTVPDRSQRLIFGISMGGYGATMYAARHPDLFAAAASISGAVNSNDPLLAGALSASSTFDGGAVDAIYGPRSSQEVRWRGHNPLDLAENLRDVDLQVRTANGTLNPGIGENPVSADLVSCAVEGGVYRGSIDFHRRLEAIGKPHAWKDYGAGCHTPANFKRQVIDTLAVFRRLLAAPPPAPSSIEFKAIEPRFDVWGWRVEADPQRALETLHMRGNADAMAFTGSGRTTVTSPAVHRGLKRVDVDGVPTAVDREGRIRFSVDLGPAHRVQQYANGAATTFVTRKVAFAPHAVVRVASARRVRAGVRVCVRAIGGSVRRARISSGGRTIRVDIGGRTRCRVVRSRRSTRVTVSGRDRFGHAVRARATVKR